MDASGPGSQPAVALVFRTAVPADIPAVAALVNAAYRGETSRAGWTTEADLLGGQRTDSDAVARLLATPESRILLAFQADALVACAHLARQDDAVEFGMFAVRPALQNAGIGKRVLAEAEVLARQCWNATRLRMTVISLRTELIAYYLRRGYRRTGAFRPFPRSRRYGIPQVDGLRLEILEKSLEHLD